MDLYTIRRELMSGKTIYDLPLRVTYYARVSTEKEEQKNSLYNQDTYYKNKILETPKWTLVNRIYR
jgi:predicted site-specific integrase-resolvase